MCIRYNILNIWFYDTFNHTLNIMHLYIQIKYLSIKKLTRKKVTSNLLSLTTRYVHTHFSVKHIYTLVEIYTDIKIFSLYYMLKPWTFVKEKKYTGVKYYSTIRACKKYKLKFYNSYVIIPGGNIQNFKYEHTIL